MNKSAVYLAIFAVLCVLAGVLVGASITRGRPYMRWSGMGHYGYNRNDRRGPFEMLAERLDLNQEQKAKVKEILEKTCQEIDAVGKNIRNSIDRIREKSDQEIMNILTLQQQEKFRALQEQFKQIRKDHMLGGKR